jgi:hypothetical protein
VLSCLFFPQAAKSGVAPSSSAWFTFAPAASSAAAVSVWPSWQAKKSGVAPPSLAWFTFAPAAISAHVHAHVHVHVHVHACALQ